VVAFLRKQVLIFLEGRFRDRPRQVVPSLERQVAPKHEAGACRNMRQVFVERVMSNRKTVLSWFIHRLLLVKRPVKRQESDGSSMGAGDGARTRDSLLGKQELSH
jgi:hypothetical protein